MKKRPSPPHRDLDALLGGVSPEEAARLREVWDLAGNREPTPFPNAEEVEQALQRFEQNQKRTDRTPQRRTPRPVWQTLRRGWPVVAVLLLLCAIGVFWWTQPLERMARPGERLTVTLPDGSQVELNSGSRLRYDRQFGAIRSVMLEGEAFFDVVEDARPFTVETFNAQVRVLGTRFAVRAWPEEMESATIVALESGRVQLAATGRAEQTVVMAPGETRRVRSELNASPPVLADLSVEEATAWREGELLFKGQFLGVVVEDIERRFDVRIQVQSPELRRQRVHLSLPGAERAQVVIHDLAEALDLRYRERSNGYELYEE